MRFKVDDASVENDKTNLLKDYLPIENFCSNAETIRELKRYAIKYLKLAMMQTVRTMIVGARNKSLAEKINLIVEKTRTKNARIQYWHKI